MSSKFVPLLPTAAPKQAAVRMGDSAAASASFVAMAAGAAAPAAAPGCAHDASNPVGKPVVTLQRDGDRVTHIRVQCACGQVIELECAY